ncbi:MAG: glycoside hydrolase family 20 zincin-like fold domain-containing protein, partial [Planctomycetota bacterium]|nr:glycoside hydrolase family 20 zincin-like fold domain-containing protein [Planctomycetota bacterium]
MTSSTRLRQFAATLALASCMSGVALGQRSEARDAAKGRGPDQQIERSAGTGLFVGGQAINSIVLPAEPLKGEKTAAEELTAYLEKMCGIKLKTEPFGKETAARTGALFLGRAAIDAGGFTDEEMGAAEYEGYRMRARNGNVYLAGGKYWGTYWGAMNFLEQLGAHFYAVDHEVVPPTGKVTIHALDLVRKPYLDLRV